METLEKIKKTRLKTNGITNPFNDRGGNGENSRVGLKMRETGNPLNRKTNLNRK